MLSKTETNANHRAVKGDGEGDERKEGTAER